MVVLTMLQARFVEQIRAGQSEAQIVASHTGQTCTYHYHKLALRKKGAISRGRQGIKGSIKVLIAGLNEPGGYTLK